MRFRLLAPWICAAALLLTVAGVLPRKSQASGDTPVHGVTWNLVDRISACPAGDTLGVSGHPSRLRINVWYIGGDGLNKIGVPPESVYVTVATDSGTAVANDIATYTFADDSTKEIGDDGGFTRIQVPSFSGNGKVAVTLFVSGVSQGTKKVYVRTVDTNHDGKVTTADETGYSDINYSGGSPNGTDAALVAGHLYQGEHWHRYALHGAMMKRTNLLDYARSNAYKTMGSGDISWSPSGRNIAFSHRDTCRATGETPCRIAFVRAVGYHGEVARQISYSDTSAGASNTCTEEDYDPAWSPTGQYVYYHRNDQVIHRKGVPGYSTDTSDVVILTSGSLLTYLSLSPNGDSLAYAQLTSGTFQVFIASVASGASRQITSDAASYFYPQWSPDGNKIIVDRSASGSDHLYTLYLRTGTSSAFYTTAAASRLPAYSPDSAVVVAGVGPNTSSTVISTLDARGTSTIIALPEYREFVFDPLGPRFSPDGTRIAFQSPNPAMAGAQRPQLFATRQNMNIPPQITDIGSQGLVDSTTRVAINCIRGLESSITVAATDATGAGDAITYKAAFLKDGMVFNEGTHVLTWTPSAAVGTVYNVKLYVTTISGGVDAAIAVLTVTASGLVVARESNDVHSVGTRDGEAVAFTTDRGRGAEVQLEVFDVGGRRVKAMRALGGERISWDGQDAAGHRVANGVYMYRVHSPGGERRGKAIVIR